MAFKFSEPQDYKSVLILIASVVVELLAKILLYRI